MNTIRIRSGLVCAVIASLAAGAAIAKNGAEEEGARAGKQQRQEQRQEHITRQGIHREQRQANNPPRQGPPLAVPPRHSPPAAVPSRPPAANPTPGGRGNNQADNSNRGGNGNHGSNNNRGGNGNQADNSNRGGNDYNGGGHNNYNNGGYYAGGRNPHFVPPPRYDNSKLRGQPPRYSYPPGYKHSPRYTYSPAYWRSQGRARPPYYVTSLPAGYHRHYWNGSPYYYRSGNWYRPYGSQYVVTTAPYGLFVPYLPFYSSLFFGNTRYYYSDGVYYNYEPVRRGYVVARSPYVGNSDAVEDLYFYPAQGQSEQQQTDDRYDCHRWSVDQVQYDPVDSSYDMQRLADYDRAITACMTGRGYAVS